MNRAGERYSVGGKLPESTGDKLLDSTGEIDSTLLGKLFRLYWGNGSTGVSVFRRGTILDQDCRGCLFRNVCILRWGMLRFSGDNPTSLRLTVG